MFSEREEYKRLYEREIVQSGGVWSLEMIKFSELCLLLSPLSVPSLILTYRLVRRKFLNTVFNQHIALMFLVTGIHVPVMTASSSHLVATSLSSSDNSTQPGADLAICKWWYSVHVIWIILIMFGCLSSLFFRYILVLFPDRGLVAKGRIQNTTKIIEILWF